MIFLLEPLEFIFVDLEGLRSEGGFFCCRCFYRNLAMIDRSFGIVVIRGNVNV